MSTRRWMVAVALVSMALGGYLEARRIKQRHDMYLARAERHASLAESFRRSRGLAARLARYDVHAQSPEGDEGSNPVGYLEHWTGESGAIHGRSEADERFEQARARAVATAELRRRIVID